MRLTGSVAPVARWREFRERQRAELRDSNRLDVSPTASPNASTVPAPGAGASTRPDAAPAPPAVDPVEAPFWSDLLGDAPASPGDRGPAHPDGSAPVAKAGTGLGAPSRFGSIGQPLNRRSPLYVGFVGTTGAMAAIVLWRSVGRLSTTMTILLVSLFLTLALNPIVEVLVRRGMRRAAAVAVVFAGVIVAFLVVALLVIPPAVTQGAALIQQVPTYVQDTLESAWVQRLDKDYQVVGKMQAELTARLTDQDFISSVLGGLLGAGRLLVSGVFQIVTVLIITLYFLSALPGMKEAAYGMVPASRRTRVESLSEEIMRRTGSYAIGQSAIATLNASLSWVMMTIVGVPYAAVLAVVVGLLGLIPMVGATLGAVIVCVVAFFDEPSNALVFAIYYTLYQQIENYAIAPRVMKRTVSVPGAVTIVAALIGGTLLGVLGALLAIPVAAGLLLLYEEVLLPRQQQQ